MFYSPNNNGTCHLQPDGLRCCNMKPHKSQSIKNIVTLASRFLLLDPLSFSKTHDQLRKSCHQLNWLWRSFIERKWFSFDLNEHKIYFLLPGHLCDLIVMRESCYSGTICKWKITEGLDIGYFGVEPSPKWFFSAHRTKF